MSNYQPRISISREGSIYAMIVRVDSDKSEHVIHGYTGRHFATVKGAERSTNKHIAKYCS